MANLNFSYSSAKTRTIEEIRFGVFSPKESERLAVIDIEYPEFTYVENDAAKSNYVILTRAQG